MGLDRCETLNLVRPGDQLFASQNWLEAEAKNSVPAAELGDRPIRHIEIVHEQVLAIDSSVIHQQRSNCNVGHVKAVGGILDAVVTEVPVQHCFQF